MRVFTARWWDQRAGSLTHTLIWSHQKDDGECHKDFSRDSPARDSDELVLPYDTLVIFGWEGKVLGDALNELFFIFPSTTRVVEELTRSSFA